MKCQRLSAWFLAGSLVVTIIIVTGDAFTVAKQSNDNNGTAIEGTVVHSGSVQQQKVSNVTNVEANQMSTKQTLSEKPASKDSIISTSTSSSSSASKSPTATSTTSKASSRTSPSSSSSPNETENSEVNVTDETAYNDNGTSYTKDNSHESWRHWHYYVFGVSFAFLGAVSCYTLTHNLVCLAASQRGHLTISHILLGMVCILRSVYLLDSRHDQFDDDVAASGIKSVTYTTLMYDSPTSLLVSSMMFYVGGLGSYTQAQWSKSRKCTAMFAVNLLATPYLLTCWTIIGVSVCLQERIDSSTRWSLSLLLKLSSLFWSVLFASITFILFKDIRKASQRKQSQIIRATLTKLHIDGTQLPKKLPKPCLSLAAKSIAVTCVLSLVTCVVLLAGVALKCDDNFLIKMAVFDSKILDDCRGSEPTPSGGCVRNQGDQVRVKITWIYFHVIRFCELAMCCSLSCGLFWSQCGHQCRRRALGDVRIAAFWSSLRKRSVWYVAPTNGSGSLAGRRRHSSDDGHQHHDGQQQHHRNCHGVSGVASSGGGSNDHVTRSSHAVSRTNFTFERWERSSRLPMNQVPVADAHFPNVQPILRTFQNHRPNHLQLGGRHSNNRISPQHRLQSHLRSSTMALQRTGRTVSTTVVAGLRSLTRSRRSSSSSISSGSSLRPSPSRPTAPPSSSSSIIKIDEERSKRRHHLVGSTSCCNKRFCCCGRCSATNKRIVAPRAHVAAPSGMANIATSHVNKKASIRRKHRKVRDVDTSNKVQMVSRATQVYIPSPQKCVEDEDEEEMDISSKVRARLSSSKRNNIFPQWSSAGRREPERESSTSCSSESAANSFDVRFYMQHAGSPKDTSTNEAESSSPAPPQSQPNQHYFHERFYGQRLLNVPYKAFPIVNGRAEDSLEEMSCSSQDMMVTVYRKFLPPKLQNRPTSGSNRVITSHGQDEQDNDDEEENKQQKVIAEASVKGHHHHHHHHHHHPTGDCSVLDLSLPLDKGCCRTALVDSKNQQDITPDSAVYLELNSPEDSTKLDLPRAWCPAMRFNMVGRFPRSISLTDLHDVGDADLRDKATKNVLASIATRRISATTTSPAGADIADDVVEPNSKMSSVSRTMLFEPPKSSSEHYYTYSKDEIDRGRQVITTSLDSLYDSGDDVVSGSSSNCNRELLHQGMT